MKKYIIIAYDIRDNRRRKKVSDLLEGYGVRVNYSVFELYISKKELSIIKAEIYKHIEKEDDNILIYHVCKSCLDKSEKIGVFHDDEPPDVRMV